MEFPKTVSRFFGMHMPKPPCKIWGLERIQCYPKSTHSLSEECALAIYYYLHTVVTLKHRPLRWWCLTCCPPTIALLLQLYCCFWHFHCQCFIYTTISSECLNLCCCWNWHCQLSLHCKLLLLLKRIFNHTHLLSELSELSSFKSLCEYIVHLISCGYIL